MTSIEIAIITGLFSLFAGAGLWSLVTKIYERRAGRRDRAEEKEYEIGKEQLISDRAMAESLWEKYNKLEAVRETLIQEKVQSATTISDLKSELRAANRLTIEQNEEIIIKDAEIDRLKRNTLTLERALADPPYGLTRKEIEDLQEPKPKITDKL